MTCTYGFRISGPCSGDRRLTDGRAAFEAYARCDEKANVDKESYFSAFTFGEDFRAHLASTGSTRGFTGVCGADWIWWDLDYPDDLDAALQAARYLVDELSQRFEIPYELFLVFFSGSKGFHIGLPTSLWAPEPGDDFHRIARRFCENLANIVGVKTDTGVYDAVQAFRAPNSRHPKSGLHKRHLSVDDLLILELPEILKAAAQPVPFEVPTPGVSDFNQGLSEFWNAAATEVRQQAIEVAQRRSCAAGNPTESALNRLTLEFIREGAQQGDRHRLLYSAARNLGDLGCPAVLAHALLTDAALDSGLSPSDVQRQIDCGLDDSTQGESK